MIKVIYGTGHEVAAEIVSAALRRSVTRGLVRIETAPTTGLVDAGATLVFVAPDPGHEEIVRGACCQGAKILLFGALPEGIARLAGLTGGKPLPVELEVAAACLPAPIYATSESLATIEWANHPLAAASPYRSRALLRYDYADEWNNMGYGRVTADGGLWSVAMASSPTDAVVLADVGAVNLGRIPHVTLLDKSLSSILWWNRSVGPVDSAEWAVIEVFLSDWRAGDLPCTPVIGEIPHGFATAVTMRLDCDEDIASARPLFELYRARGIPFSVAIKTDQSDSDAHLALLNDVLSAGGAVLSHSVTHAPRWGGSGEACYHEARQSSDWLEARLPGHRIRYAVSPFHQNPSYVPEALKRAGLEGFVGGIIANDPDMLLARGGEIPGDSSGVVTHSQQCMMHGECILAEGDPLAINKQAFSAAVATGTLFGFLDHPFSPRYDYGWGSEEHRLSRHSQFLDYIEQEMSGPPILWLNEEETLDWIAAKSRLKLEETNDGSLRLTQGNATCGPRGLAFMVRWKGRTRLLSEFLHG